MDRVRLREWDPANATDSDLRLWLDAYNTALTADLPLDPEWGPASLSGYLSRTMPGERRVNWLVDSDEDGQSAILGHASLLMMDGLAVVEIFVVPEARRKGIGRGLLATVARRSLSEGLRTMGVEVAGGTTGIDFYEALGFRWAYVEMRSLLDLSSMDWQGIDEMAKGVVTGDRKSVV